jgi:hypothetical protein
LNYQRHYATSPPPCHLAAQKLFLHILYALYDSHERENDVTKEIRGNQISAISNPFILLSSLGRAKNYRYQQYFVPLEINKALFHSGAIAFLLHQLKALDQSFRTVSWLTFGSEI